MELFTEDTITARTVDDILSGNNTSAGIPVVDNGSRDGDGTQVGGAKIGGSITGGAYYSNIAGARVEVFPEYDDTIGFASFDVNGVSVFKTIIDGADVGDVIIGDYAGGKGAKWDQSAAVFNIKGDITGCSGTFSGSLSSGISISAPSISGGTISGTTITGSTFTTTGGSYSVKLNNSTNQIELLYSDVVQGTISAWSYAQGKAIAIFADTFDPGVSGTGMIIQEGTTSKITFYVEGTEADSIP